MAGEIEAKLKAERMFAEAQAKALGGPYAALDKEYVNRYMDSSSLSKALSGKVSPNYSKGYFAGWAGIPGDMLNALTSWAVAGIPDKRMRGEVKRSLRVSGTDEIGEAMGADTDSAAFVAGTVGLPGFEDLISRSPYLSMVLLHGTKDARKLIPRGGRAKDIREIFDTKYIGDASKGEGATAFGWGLYFAQRGGVAGTYKPMSREISSQAKKALDRVDNLGFDSRGEAISAIRAERKKGNDWTKMWDVDPQRDGQDVIDILNNEADEAFGALFEADVPDEVVGEMLDWNAPLSEQPMSVKLATNSIIDKYGHKAATALDSEGTTSFKSLSAADDGAEFYNRLAEIFRQEQGLSHLEAQKAASKLLNHKGVPGLRYWDAPSRAKAEGTRNVVLFSPDDITQVKRDGEIVYETAAKGTD